jgi:RHS repeat-associated protein
VEASYDKVGNLLTYEDPAGLVTYTYDDDANLLRSLKEPGGTCPSSGAPAAYSDCVLFAYDENGKEATRTFPGGATVTTTRDASARPTRIVAKNGASATVADVGYTYVTPGTSTDRTTIQTRTSHLEQGVTAGAITTYVYDAYDRVTQAQEKSGATVKAQWDYAYDAAGNRTSQTRTGLTGAAAGTISYTVNAANQITASSADTTTWTYDSAGNQTRNGLSGDTATYGDRLQATQINSYSQSYFGGGNNIRTAGGPATFVNTILGEMQLTVGTLTASTTRDPNGKPVGYRAAAHNFFALDALGSVMGLFSATGTWSGGYSYSPYGETRAAASAYSVTINPIRYIGGHWDQWAEVYKLGHRYYDPTIGRFTQPDPSGQESHPYAYAGCNPINGKDPTGLDFGTACAVTAGVLGGISFAAGAVVFVAGAVATPVTGGGSLVLGAIGATSIITGAPAALLGGLGIFGDC